MGAETGKEKGLDWNKRGAIGDEINGKEIC